MKIKLRYISSPLSLFLPICLQFSVPFIIRFFIPCSITFFKLMERTPVSGKDREKLQFMLPINRLSASPVIRATKASVVKYESDNSCSNGIAPQK
jgi:hypothetical protein